ncbi:hypothetical protein [Nostoc sp.]
MSIFSADIPNIYILQFTLAKFPQIMVDVKRKMQILGELQSLRVFKTDFVILDFYLMFIKFNIDQLSIYSVDENKHFKTTIFLF